MIHHRQQLINWLTKNITDRVIQQALESGRVENCGGFNSLSGSLPGFVVAVTSGRGTIYNIAIVVDNFQMRWFRLKKIPWWNWVGDKSNSSVCQGDRPKVYKVLKERLKNET